MRAFTIMLPRPSVRINTGIKRSFTIGFKSKLMAVRAATTSAKPLKSSGIVMPGTKLAATNKPTPLAISISTGFFRKPIAIIVARMLKMLELFEMLGEQFQRLRRLQQFEQFEHFERLL